MFQCDPFPRNRDNAGDEGEGDKALTTDPLTLGAIPNLFDGKEIAAPPP